jgi:hypothetical protein
LKEAKQAWQLIHDAFKSDETAASPALKAIQKLTESIEVDRIGQEIEGVRVLTHPL